MVWRTRALTIPKSHLPCQDSTRHQSDGRNALLVVADGSGAEGEKASGVIAEFVMEQYSRLLRTDIEVDGELWVGQLMKAAVDGYEQWISKDGRVKKDNRSTLGVALIADDEIWFSAIGDAFLVLLGNTSCAFFNHGGQRGEYANEATMVDAKAPLKSFHIYSPDISAAILTTDGLEKWVESRSFTVTIDVTKVVPVGQFSNCFSEIAKSARQSHDDESFLRPVLSLGLQRLKKDDVGVAVAFR